MKKNKKLFTLVFHFCGFSATQMALGLVALQNGLRLYVKASVKAFEPFGEVLVYGGFAHAIFFRGIPDRCSFFHDVLAQQQAALFYVTIHIDHSKLFC